jgi:mono/diheme cytochrome c family protein
MRTSNWIRMTAVCVALVAARGAGGDASSRFPRPASINPLYAEGYTSYQLRCAPCHGETGDGSGAIGRLLAPRPRDFTSGVYKLRSTPSGTLPLDADLARTIRRGVHGTGMPPWCPSLTDGETQNLVRHLKSLAARFGREAPGVPVEVPPAPPGGARDIETGRRIYERMSCSRCHGDEGRGDGASATALRRDDGDSLRPRDLRARGSIQSGDDPHDLYRALATGLDGTPMGVVELTPDERWALTRYVLSLSDGSAVDR